MWRHRLAIRSFAAILLVVCCCGPTAAQENIAPARGDWEKNEVDLRRLFDAVVDTIEQRFFDEGLLRRLDWRARAAAVRPSVVSAATLELAVRHVNELLAELKTSHTALFTPDDYEYYILLDIVGLGSEASGLMNRRFWGSGPYYPGIGAFTRRVDERHFIDGVLEGSPADRAGLQFGDEILSVDGTPYSTIAVFRGKLGRTVDLEVRRGDGAAPESVTVSVIPIWPSKAFAAATMASTRVIERNERRIGYVHLWAVHDAQGLKSAVEKLNSGNLSGDRPRPRFPSTAEGQPLDLLVVDARGRVGGNVGAARQYLEVLDARRPYWGSWRSVHRSRYASSMLGFPFLASETREGPAFGGRSALLIDQRTRSAGEFLAYGYKRAGFGPLVGTTTAGAVSSGALVPMPGDLLLYVAVAGHEFDNGHRIEGVGVAPDHEVERPLPYASGADPVLETAIELLLTRPSQN